MNGLLVRHKDGDGRNARLDNLEYGDTSQNHVDMVLHGRHWQANKTSCPEGHLYTEQNTLWRRDRPGQRECRTCNIARKASRPSRAKTQHDQPATTGATA